MISIKKIATTIALMLALTGYANAQGAVEAGGPGAVSSSRGAVNSVPSALNRVPSAAAAAPSAVDAAPSAVEIAAGRGSTPRLNAGSLGDRRHSR
jgi:hypothetical protein